MATIDYTDRRRMRLDVEFYFAAAHRLPRYEGPCFRMHGHNYRMFVAVEGETDPHKRDDRRLRAASRESSRSTCSPGPTTARSTTSSRTRPPSIARWVYETPRAAPPGLAEVRLY